MASIRTPSHSLIKDVKEDLQMCMQQEVDHYDDMQTKFQNACSQVILLNNSIQDTQIRYDRALHDNHRSFRYMLRLRLMSLEGARNMFYEYASRKAEQLDSMQERLSAQGLMNREEDEANDDL